MKDPHRDWITALYVYWLLQFIAIIIAVFVVILIAVAVFGEQQIMEVLNILNRWIDDV